RFGAFPRQGAAVRTICNSGGLARRRRQSCNLDTSDNYNMCGIAGLAGRFSRDYLSCTVHAMTDAIAHRGPDDEGFWVGENFAFGMRRLSIIDLAGGHQPMWDSRTGIGIVYNGEVYNYKAVRSGLQNSGVTFRTTSDTEVVLQSLAIKGREAVHDWNGMFAVATWDPREEKLL